MNNLSGDKEHSLVVALQKGKKEVLSVLYDEYAPAMMGVISKIVEDEEQAELVLQQTFLAIWSRIGIYDTSKDRFLTWGLAIARGIALKAKSKFEKSNEATKGKNPVATTVNKANATSKQGLSPLQKSILDLIYLNGKSCSEASAILGVSETELLCNLRQAFQQLKAAKRA